MSTFLFLCVAAIGAMWGVGKVSNGLTMRYLGMSLGIGVAIGVTLIVGTLVPPIMHGQAAMLFSTRSGLITLSGVLVALIGVAIVSWARHQNKTPKGSSIERSPQGIHRRTWTSPRGALRNLLFRNVLRDRCRPTHGVRSEVSRCEPALRCSSQLRDHHGRRRGDQLCLLL